jgi:hypothetical protein
MCNCPKRVKEYVYNVYHGDTRKEGNSDFKRNDRSFIVVLIEMILNYERMLYEYRMELYLILKDYPELLNLFYLNAIQLREYVKNISYKVKFYELDRSKDIRGLIRWEKIRLI